MVIIDYVNESGQNCQAGFVEEGTFDWNTGTYPKYRTYRKPASYFQEQFEDKLTKCKYVRRNLIDDDCIANYR